MSVPGLATMWSPATARNMPPLAATSPQLTTTRLPAWRSRLMAWCSVSLPSAEPPGDDTRSTTALTAHTAPHTST